MDGLMYILPALIIVAMVIFLVFKLKGNGSSSATPNRVATANSDYSGPRKDVIIKDFGSKKLEVIKFVREATGCGLKEAKDVVESRGTIEALPIEVAEALVSNLNNIGASAELK